jgi:hypothetical protein
MELVIFTEHKRLDVMNVRDNACAYSYIGAVSNSSPFALCSFKGEQWTK